MFNSLENVKNANIGIYFCIFCCICKNKALYLYHNNKTNKVMKTSVDSREFDIAKVSFNGELQQVKDLNWNELTSFTKARLLKFMSDLFILKQDYILTENQEMTVASAETRLIEYISRSNK